MLEARAGNRTPWEELLITTPQPCALATTKRKKVGWAKDHPPNGYLAS
ncbi:MAG: hypothetical protein M1503_04485 [Thaumarchaeota archaeon]|nr:hypothetical protein [Nitrososphaerota archaeon]